MAFVTIGGMMYVVGTLWATQLLAASWEDGRLVAPGNTAFLFMPVMSLVVCAFVMKLYLSAEKMHDDDERHRKDAEAGLLTHSAGSFREIRQYDSTYGELASTGVICFGLVILAMCFISIGVDSASFLVAFTLTSSVAAFVASFFDKRMFIRGLVVGAWMMGYLTTWCFGWMHPISLPAFVAGWLVVGGLIGYNVAIAIHAQNIADAKREARRKNALSKRTIVGGGSDFSDAGYSAAATGGKDFKYRQRHTSGIYSEFGRLPKDTVNVLAHLTRSTNGPIVSSLPVTAQAHMYADTVRIVLDHLILDWRQNNNLRGLDASDIEDIRTFVVCASSFINLDYDKVNRATYRTILKYLMVDWLNNWNSNDTSGPPPRR